MSAPKEFTFVHYGQLFAAREGLRRSDVGDLSRLKASLVAQGWRWPLGVRKHDDSTYEVINGLGYRRYIALQELVREGCQKRLERVPVQVFRDGDAVDDLLILLASDVHEAMPRELRARAVGQLLEHQLPVSEIASLTGMPLTEARALASAVPKGGAFNALVPANEFDAPIESESRRIELLRSFAQDMPEHSRARISPILDPLLLYLEGGITAKDALLRLAYSDSAPPG
jgi:hypothetical protein